MDERKLPSADKNRVVEPIWGVAANIVKERPYGPGGEETKIGTRKFHGGAKVYVTGAYWGMGAQHVAVIGHYRGKHPYIASIVRIEHLEKFRAELIYSPTIINRIEHGPLNAEPFNPPLKSREDAEKAAKLFQGLAERRKHDKAKKSTTSSLGISAFMKPQPTPLISVISNIVRRIAERLKKHLPKG